MSGARLSGDTDTSLTSASSVLLPVIRNCWGPSITHVVMFYQRKSYPFLSAVTLYRNPLQPHDHMIYERSLRRSRAVLSRWWIRVKWHKSIVTQNFSPANIHPSWERNKENVFKPSPCQFKITIFIMDHMDQSSVPDMTHNPSTTNLGFNKIFNNKIGNYQAEMNRKTLHVCIIWNIYYFAVTYCKSLSPGDWCPSDGVHNILTHIDLSIPLQLDITRTRDLREHNSSCHCSKSLIIMYLLKLSKYLCIFRRRFIWLAQREKAAPVIIT